LTVTSLITIGCEMKKVQYFENMITVRTPATRTTFVAIGKPIPGQKKLNLKKT